MYELRPIYDTRKSFYGKAIVKEETRKNVFMLILYSYMKPVARVEKYDNRCVFRILGKFSQTTTRHQKEFFKQNGVNEEHLKRLFKEEVLVYEN